MADDTTAAKTAADFRANLAANWARESMPPAIDPEKSPEDMTPEDIEKLRGLHDRQWHRLHSIVSMAALCAAHTVPSPDLKPLNPAAVGRPPKPGFRQRDGRIDPDGPTALRFRLKRGEKLVGDVKELCLESAKLRPMIMAYNSKACALDPALYREIESMAHKATPPVSPDAMLKRVFDAKDPEASLTPLRDRMTRLSNDPGLAADRLEIERTVDKTNSKLHQISETLTAMAADKNPELALNADAAAALRQKLGETVGQDLTTLPQIQARTPGEKPGGLVDEAKAGFEKFDEKIKEIVESVKAMVSKVLGH